MAMVNDFRGARASNAGDDYHELWVTRQAIRLLGDKSLKAIAVEGIGGRDEAGKPSGTWDGVDCTLYFGGTTLADASRVEIVQVKYSTAKPQKKWTASRLVRGGRSSSILSKLAKAWKEVIQNRPISSCIVTLVSNQPIQPEVESAMRRISTSAPIVPTHAPKATAPSEKRLAHATNLTPEELRDFASSFSFQCGDGSRLALEEQVLRAIGEWTDQDVRHVVTDLQDFIRRKMMPESACEPIMKESVLAHLGISEESALFPCPSEIELIESPVCRASISDAGRMIQSNQYICLHGEAGVGKTTALQEIESSLPDGSIMLKYDCYGGGRYLDPSALRHRTKDAFLQLTNEVAARLQLPLFLLRRPDTDYPRQFMHRLDHAAATLLRWHPESLLIIAIDAADNAIFASQQRQPPEPAFVHDFVQLANLPTNVRFVLTARTGRLDCLQLPTNYRELPVRPFSQLETNEYVTRVWSSADPAWLEDFHHLSSGVPRVQATAFAAVGKRPQEALRRLMPNGKSLQDVFSERFREAIAKGGTKSGLSRLCAALVALPRPVPLSTLASILNEPEAQVLDVCRDLAPSIRCHDHSISFADEDLEHFVRDAGTDSLADIRGLVATWMLNSKGQNRYAALNVAATLLAAYRRSELLDLVEAEPSPPDDVLPDPVLRREAELQRLRLAINVCREAKDVPRALRFVLVGAESIQTEAALRDLLTESPDLAVRFAEDAVRRIVLSDPSCIKNHGAFLFHKLAVDGGSGNAISAREGRRRLVAWLEARRRHAEDEARRPDWKIEVAEISSMVEAALKLHGPRAALDDLARWQPRRIKIQVGLSLPWQLIAEDGVEQVEVMASDYLSTAESLFVLVPLALSGRPIDTRRIADGVRRLLRRLSCDQMADDFGRGLSQQRGIFDLMLTAIEILATKNVAADVVNDVLTSMLECGLSQIEKHSAYQVSKLDMLLRAYTLREVLHGRSPTVTGMFKSRQGPEDDDTTSARDDRVKRVAGATIEAYTAVAAVLVKRSGLAQLEEVIARFSEENWALSNYGSTGLKGCIGAHLGLLLVTGCDPEAVWKIARRVHDDWQDGRQAPDKMFVARFRLWPRLHGSMIGEIGTAAHKTRSARMAARDKIPLLADYARMLLPISKQDAMAVFNLAVSVVGELDVEVMEHIGLLTV